MKIASLDKENFLDWLGGRVEPRTERLTARWYKGKVSNRISLIWADENPKNQALPLVVVPENEMHDFYAFVSTYVSTYRPFSAFFTVLPFELLQSTLTQSTVAILPREVYSKLIAVALAEAYAQSRGKVRTLNDLTVQGVQATLSATLMSAVWKGFKSEELVSVADRWVMARNLISQGSLAIKPREILDVWETINSSILSTTGSKRARSKNQLSDLLRNGLLDTNTFDEWFIPFVRKILGSDDSIKTLKGAREGRIKIVPHIVNSLRHSKAERSVVEFVAGGLLSMVGNGSMSQLHLTDQLTRELPKSVLWFGAISAFQSQSDALVASNCLGRRALRDLLKANHPFSPPEHDISLDELNMLGEKALLSDAIRTEHRGTISVGLLCSVQAPFRRTPIKKDGEDRTVQLRQSPHESERMDELRVLLERANRIARELHRPLQRDFFEMRQTKPRNER